MKRDEFKNVVKAFSFWKIDKRKGNFTLPNGEKLSWYLKNEVKKILKNNSFAIAENGNIYGVIDNKIMIPFSDTDSEIVNDEEQSRRVKVLVEELLY